MERLSCATCGAAVYLAPSQIARRQNPERITCSRECSQVIRKHPTLGWKGYPSKSIEKPCQQCGASMMVKQSLMARKKYCSRRCAAKGSYCLTLANSTPAVWTASRREAYAARWRGKGSPTWVEPIVFTCPQCQQPFGLKPFEVKRRTEHFGYPPKFCSRACHMAHKRTHTGPQSSAWRGGNATYRGPGWRVLRLVVIADQHGCCATCGKFRGTRLHVHHRRLYSDHATSAEANRAENLVGLCESCHGKLDGRPDRLRRINTGRRAV